MTKKTVAVRILDQDFMITTDASPEHVKKVAEFLNRNLNELMSKHKTLSTERAVLLTALNIAEKYFGALEKQNQFKTRVAEKTKNILNLLEMTGAPPSAE